MSDITRWSASELASALASTELSSVEATQAHLDRIDATDHLVGSFLARAEDALATARGVDKKRAAGEKL